MKLSLYSIHDRELGVYLSPFVARADVEAVRQIKSSLADPQMKQSPIALSPSTYDLCFVAVFDDETGILEAGKPRILGNVRDLIPQMGDIQGSSTVLS